VNDVIKCDGCDEEATVHCVVCQEYLGPACSRSHKRLKGSAGHQQIPLEEALAGTTNIKRIPRCQKHVGFEIDTYCRTCNDSVCSQCIVANHSGHTFVALDSITAPLQEEITNFNIIIEKREKEAKKAITTMDGTINEMDENRTSVEKEINTLCDSVAAAVEQRRIQVIGEIVKIRETVVGERRDAETAGIEFREFRVFTEGLLAQGTPQEIAGSRKMVSVIVSYIASLFSLLSVFFFPFLFLPDPSQK
jgi:hypothetical protein